MRIRGNGIRISLLSAAAVALAAVLAAACGGSEPAAAPAPAPEPAVSASPAAPAPAMEEKELPWEGETLRVVVPWGPGYSTDAHARAVVRFLPKYLPGNPKTVVVNKEGAAGTTGGNWYAERGKGDGLWLYVNTGSNPVNQVTRPGVRYDFRDFTSIGGIMQRPTIWMISGDAPYKRLQDAINGDQEFTIGLNLVEDVANARIRALKEWLNLPVKPLFGVGSGFATYLRTFDRGDADSYISGSAWQRTSASRPDWFSDGTVVPFALLAPESLFAHNGQIDVPSDLKRVDEFLTPEQQKEWQAMLATDTFFYRGVWTKKETPEHVVQALRDAFQQMLKDPEYRVVYERLVGLPPEEGGAIRGEDVQAALGDFFSDPKDLQAILKKHLPPDVELPDIS